MSESIRIKTTPNGNDTFLKLKLEQDFDFIEILSLKLSQEDVYRKFCSDYGVICGRVVVNVGFGVPNAKVSVFVPIDDIDTLNPEIKGLYPYELVTDKNSDGIRYNLLPKKTDNQDICFTPIGSFPDKREFLDNNTLLDVYCKYYKFTTTTNHAGDFMIFGVPLGNYIVQVDTDISDIGIITQKPYDLISKGTSQKLFETPTKYKADKNLDKLIQVKTLRSGVTVRPFWGDLENCEIGINRLDFDLQTNITPSALFVGSIFGDNEKHSINKHCRPRIAMGRLCDMTTGEGTIEMLRKTFDGKIEQFDVEGGRVIDTNGAWAYQVPMNLDYVVTDEVGNLIPSDDSNIGLPTRASVRFKVGMDVTGDEGRLRTRAKYLIPNNPSPSNPSDYSFDDSTKDYSFRNLYWNKIYSVKNFIPRYQTNSLIINRNMTGIKDVDNCTGTHTPFPYNRMLTELNPVFSVLCILLTIIIGIIGLINTVVIRFVNIMINLLNGIISVINTVIGGIVSAFCSVWNIIAGLPGISIGSCPISPPNIQPVSFVPCITLTCDNQIYAPGCDSGTYGFNAANVPIGYINHYPNDGHIGHNVLGAGLADCYAIQLAEALDVFEFDFYNDWVNGSLYAFLLKYKKKKHGQEKFCEYDCSPNFSGGVDGNNDSIPDNDCVTSYLVDSCAYTDGFTSKSFSLEDGLIKKVDDEFYYASYTHSGDKLLFATDIIYLGSIFDCDWQGIPKIEQLLVPTTYKRPPNTSEYEGTVRTVCGISSTGTNNPNDGLFFDINCLAITVNTLRCQNLRKQCEFGVDLDSEIIVGGTITPANCNIGPEELDQNGIYFRDVFYNLNKNGINVTTYPYLTPINTSFDSSSNIATAILGPVGPNDVYNGFRNFQPNTNSSYEQPIGNSYFFYFGLIPGKTAVDLLNTKFFNPCKQIISEDFFIIGVTNDVTNIGGNDGSITGVTVVGNSTPPYTYAWTGPSGFTSTSQNLINLNVGIYTVIVTDNIGLKGKASFAVNQPQPLSCSVSVNKSATLITSNDGEVIINGVGGGNPPYFYNLTGPVNFNGGPNNSFNSLIIGGLFIGTYTMDIYDSSTPVLHCITTGLTVTSPASLNYTVTKTNATCYSSATGSLVINILGGVPPYSISTVCTALGYNSTLITQNGLQAGTYVTTIQDSLAQINIQTNIITQDGQMLLAFNSGPCDSTFTKINVSLFDPNTVGPWTVTTLVDGINRANTTTPTSPTDFDVVIGGAEAVNNYSITFTNPNNCGVTLTLLQSQIPRPASSLNVSIAQLVIMTAVQFNSTPSGGFPPYSYIWKDITLLGLTISTNQNILENYNVGEQYSLTITDSKGCQKTIYHTIF